MLGEGNESRSHAHIWWLGVTLCSPTTDEILSYTKNGLN